MKRHGLIFLLLLSGCSPARFFYYPNRTLYADPDKLKIPCEVVHYPSLNGKTLYGLYFPTDQTPKGLVVHFHGNFGNVSNHFPLSLFLVKRGFDVLIFDYEGYGASEGSPTPPRAIDDGIATVRYAQTRLRNPQSGVVLFGQSLGAATGIVVAAREPLVKAMVAEAPFSSYRAMARDMLKRHVWLWPLYPVYPFFLTQRYDPVRFVAQISPRPILFIHGSVDRTVPVGMSRLLYEKAGEPKRLWIVEGADHLECRRKAGTQYEETIADFFSRALATSSGSN